MEYDPSILYNWIKYHEAYFLVQRLSIHSLKRNISSNKQHKGDLKSLMNWGPTQPMKPIWLALLSI